MNPDEEFQRIVDSSVYDWISDDETEKDSSIVEQSKEDENDLSDIKKMYDVVKDDCCHNRCNSLIPKDVALKHRYDFMELKKKEQDLIILAHFQAHRRINDLLVEYGKLTIRKESRVNPDAKNSYFHISHYFADLPICRNMYFFLYNLGIKRYKNLLHHFDEQGIIPRVHKSFQKVSRRSNTISTIEIENVKTFITTLAEKTALPLPGRLPQFRDYKVMKLPSSETKISVYEKYKKARIEATGKIDISLVTFRKLWNDHCPYVTTMKPADDLCDICRQNNLDIMKAANVDDELKQVQLTKAIDHLNSAHVQREFYNSWRQKAKSSEPEMLAVVSFDFAQNVSFPSSPQQVGTSYFKALRKCSIFGVQNEKTQVQTNFLIDEEDATGKGANSVISMIHCYLENIQPAEHLVLFADNCVGQNKNNAMIHYLVWRIMRGLNKRISLNFLLTGHTKFSPDRNFGILKSKYSLANVDCTQDLVEVVNTSSPNGYNIAIPSIDPTTKIRNVEWYEWDSSLRSHFKSIQGVTKYHHFDIEFSSQIIKARIFADTPEVVIYEFERLNVNNIDIKKIKPTGLTIERQWYLYEQVRNLCNKEENKDSVAPKPKTAKKKKNDPVAPAPKTTKTQGKNSDGPELKAAKEKEDSVCLALKIPKNKRKDSVAPESKAAKKNRKKSPAPAPTPKNGKKEKLSK